MEEKIHSFEKLECWKSAKEIQLEVSKLIKTFPAEEKFRLSDQMIRCSRSMTNNIAEGYGRYHYLENAKFCSISRGSLMELLDHLIIAKDSGFITEDIELQFRKKISACHALLNGYIKYLLNAKKEI